MNYYIVVEGNSGERKVYPFWISYINSKLTHVDSISEIVQNNYILISGNGYPQYYKMIDNAIEDVNCNRNIDYLVIAIDAEEHTFDEKMKEITDYINGKIDTSKVKLIIQTPCLESWALGNRMAYRRHPQNEDLRKYLAFYNVRELDPELMPGKSDEGLNKAQFAYKYLKRILNERYDNLSYTKKNPEVLQNQRFFTQIKLRYDETNQIKSFNSFISTFLNE
jgi:hypothetical protein